MKRSSFRHVPAIRLTFSLRTTLVFLAGVLPVPYACAQAVDTAARDTVSFDISAGPLDQALAQFGRRTGTLISYDASLATGRSTRGLRGDYTVAHGLAQLLSGTGLQARPLAQGGWLLLAAPDVKAAVLLERVEVTGQTGDPKDEMYRTAGSTHYLSRDDIERFRGTSVGDMFQGIPGVLVGENRNSGGLDINIRGMQGQSRVPVLIDGARQETTVYRGYSGVASRTYVDPDLIGGIEIEKGPTMNPHGTGATGGLVSARTINAGDIVKDGASFGIRVRGTAIGNNSGSASAEGVPAGYNVGVGKNTFRINCRPGLEALCSGANNPDSVASDETMDRRGTFNPRSYAGSVALANRWERFDLVAAYAQREQGNYYAGKHGPTPYLVFDDYIERGFYTQVKGELKGATRFRGEERVANTNFESRSFLLKGKLLLNADQDVEMSWMRYKSTYGELMPSQLRGIGDVRQTSGSHVTSQTWTSRYRWQPADNRWLDFRANLWHTNTDSYNQNYADGDILGNGMEELLGGLERPQHYKRTGLDLSNLSLLDAAGDYQLQYGVSLQWERLGPPLSEDDKASLVDGHAGRRNEQSVFVSLQLRPIDSVTVNMGVRHSRFTSKDDMKLYHEVFEPSETEGPGGGGRWRCRDEDGDGQCDGYYAKATKHGTAPIVSLAWEPWDGVQLYGRYAEAYRMPSLFETTYGFSFSPAQDVDLDPEHAKNKEVGVNFIHDSAFLPGDKLRLRAAYFKNHIKDYLTRTSNNLWDANYGRTFYTMRNIRGARFHGYELGGSYDTGGLFADFGATRYTFIETCHYGSYRPDLCTDYGIANSYITNMIPPKWHASATLGMRLFERRLMLGVRGTFMGARTRQPEYNDQTKQGSLAPVPWEAYKVFDLFASYRVNDTLSLDFNLDNFTDRYYLDALSLGRVPAPGRTARLSATLQF